MTEADIIGSGREIWTGDSEGRLGASPKLVHRSALQLGPTSQPRTTKPIRYASTQRAGCAPRRLATLYHLLLPEFTLAPMPANSRPQSPDGQDHWTPTLSVAIEGFNLAKEVMNITPAKAAFGSVAIILAMIRVLSSLPQSFVSKLKDVQDSMLNEKDYVELGIACADVCIALSRGMKGRSLADLNESVLKAIAQLTT